MISLKNETVQQIITDIMGISCDWKPNGGVCEGYRINVGESIEDINFHNFFIDRLRIRMNTVERILNAPHLNQEALRYWRFAKINTTFWELRIYDTVCSPYKDNPCLKNVQLFEEMATNHDDSYMSFGEYMLKRAYETERSDDPTGDLLNDFARDTELMDINYAVGYHIYSHITLRACDGCSEALDDMVEDYRKYCQEKNLLYDHFKTCREEEAENSEEDEQ